MTRFLPLMTLLFGLSVGLAIGLLAADTDEKRIAGEPEDQIRDAIAIYVAAVNTGDPTVAGLTNCAAPFYTGVAASRPGVRPFRYDIAAIELQARTYQIADGVSFEIRPDRVGEVAVVRGIAYLGDRAVVDLIGSSFADTGWVWELHEGTWHNRECS